MAGKGLKDVTALNKCSACGHVKRAHLLCPYCLDGKMACTGPEKRLLINYRDQENVQVEERRASRGEINKIR